MRAPLTKECKKCRRELPLSDFYDHPQTSDGKEGRCKECAKAANNKKS
jgi:hypothetical protein